MKLISKNCCKKKRVFLYRFILTFLFSITLSQLAFSQVEISGKITDQVGESIVGATVIIKGTTTGVITNSNGEYTIPANEGDILEASFIGYLTKEIAVVAGVTTLNITLLPDLIGLDEVVVIGYGTQRKGDLTSAISTVKSDEFIEGAVKDAGQLLQGKVAGLTINNPSGDPRENVKILLRGNSTLRADLTPLVIIDGVPGDLNTVAPQDIESIDILKDGSAAAIYGTRGTNGVIIITTKQGRLGERMKVEYNGYISTQQIIDRPDFMDAEEYRIIAEDDPGKYDFGGSTDWLDEIMQTPFSQMHGVNVTGGTEKTAYSGSFNYTDNEGIFLYSGIKRYIARLGVTQNFFNGKASVNVGAILNNTSSAQRDETNYAYRQALIRNPTDSVTDANGDWMERPSFQYYNPVAILEEEHTEVETRTNRIYGNLKIMPLPGLSANLLLSRELFNETKGKYNTSQHYSSSASVKGTAYRSGKQERDDLVELTIDYSKSIGQHNVAAMAGYTYNYEWYDFFEVQNDNFPLDFYEFYDLSQGFGKDSGNVRLDLDPNDYNRYSSTLVGFVGRANYNYAGKYYLQASLRYEGSSKFGDNNKWGTFPAFQAGWKLSEEDFIKNINAISNLKIRGGYGVTGVMPRKNYLAKTLLTYSDYVFYNGEWIRTVAPTQNPNKDLKWETKYEINFGIDFGLFNNRLSGSVDLYKRTTKDLLWNYQIPSPPNLYSSILANVGEMENKGIELLIQGLPVMTKDFSWTATFTFSANKNKLVSLENDKYELAEDFYDWGNTGDPIWAATQRLYIGENVGDFYTYKVVDINVNETLPTFNGKWLVENVDGDSVLLDQATADDRQIIGNGIPDFYIGFNNTFRYKNIDLSVVMHGAFGHQILNYQRMFYENPTIAYNTLSNANDLIFGKTQLNEAQQYVSYYIEDGDFWKISNINLGYTHYMKNNQYVKSIRIYATIDNVYTFTKYKGLDPEVNWLMDLEYNIAPGIDDRDKFPTTRTYTLGLNVIF